MKKHLKSRPLRPLSVFYLTVSGLLAVGMIVGLITMANVDDVKVQSLDSVDYTLNHIDQDQ